jgi:hypothetical protein
VPPLRAQSLDGSSFEGHVFIGAFAAGAREVGIWQRLIGPDADIVYFDTPEEAIRAVTPRSREGKAYVADPAVSAAWRELVQPDRMDRAFAMAGNHLVVGAPTEEVWETFEGILNL